MALDVGDARIGVALASQIAALANPYGVIANDDHIWQSLRHICAQEHVSSLVIGLPRSMEGNDTEQTAKVRVFASTAEVELSLPVHFQDEALTSVKAEAELKARGSRYNKAMIDSLAATYILEDFLTAIRRNA